MYKDKDRQREANRERVRRYRAKQKGVTDKALQDDFEEEFVEIPVSPHVVPHPKAVSVIPKRGKDIKTFEDLPPDVQDTINRLRGSNEAEHKRRTAAAIKYQHIFPNSYDSVSDGEFTRLLAKACPGHIRVSKPGDLDYEPECETTRAYIQSKGVAL